MPTRVASHESDQEHQLIKMDLAGRSVAEMEVLPPRTRDVLALYFGAGLRLREIGEIYGFTEGRACQIVAAGLDALRTRLAAA